MRTKTLFDLIKLSSAIQEVANYRENSDYGIAITKGDIFYLKLQMIKNKSKKIEPLEVAETNWDRIAIRFRRLDAEDKHSFQYHFDMTKEPDRTGYAASLMRLISVDSEGLEYLTRRAFKRILES